MAVRLAAGTASAMATAVRDRIDAGAGAGTLKVYTGSLPSDLAVGSSTLLATFTLTDPSGTVDGAGVFTLDFDPDLSAIVAVDGTPGWFLVEDSTGVDVLGGTVGTSGTDLVFESTIWVAGNVVYLMTGVVTQPAT